MALALAAALFSAPAALAAVPANDDFANAEDFGVSLPINVSRSNAEATKETGEPSLFASAGHSVWFKWKAAGDEPITVDTCDSEFQTNLAVFTGTGLGELTEVSRDENVDGRFCPGDGSGATFRPVSGTVYWVLVDGNSFHVEGSPPATQGSFKLKIAPVPTPANDAFAQATPIATSVSLETEDEFSYSAWSDGFTWNATKEPGEPQHAGDQGGASVWYRWTAPRSGHAEVGACGALGVLVGLYTGDAVNALTPVSLESRPVPCFVNFSAVAGTTYRIAIDGKFDNGSGLPTMTRFNVHVSMQVPKSRPGGSSNHPADTTPPNTTISRTVFRRMPPVWVFKFQSTEPGSSFECKLDKRPFTKCKTSKTFKNPKPGRHTLKVRAIDPSGNVDPSPAVAHFTVPRKLIKAHATH